MQLRGGCGLLFVMTGISVATVTALEKAYAGDLLPDNVRGTGYGLLEAVKGVGFLSSNLIIGSMLSTGAVSSAFMYAACVSVIAMIFLFMATAQVVIPVRRGTRS